MTCYLDLCQVCRSIRFECFPIYYSFSYCRFVVFCLDRLSDRNTLKAVRAYTESAFKGFSELLRYFGKECRRRIHRLVIYLGVWSPWKSDWASILPGFIDWLSTGIASIMSLFHSSETEIVLEYCIKPRKGSQEVLQLRLLDVDLAYKDARMHLLFRPLEYFDDF